MAHSGYVVSFEGQDACGKSTLIREVGGLLKHDGYDVKTVDEFSSSVMGDHIRSLLTKDKFLRFGSGARSALTETMYVIADLYFQHEMEITPFLAPNTIILKERHIDTIFACQIPKITEDYPHLTHQNLYDWVTQQVLLLSSPNLTFLLSLPKDVQIERIKKRGENISEKDVQIFDQREIIYANLASKHKDRIVVFQNDKSLQEASIEIASLIQKGFSYYTNTLQNKAAG